MMSLALDASRSALIHGLQRSAPKVALDKKGYVSDASQNKPDGHGETAVRGYWSTQFRPTSSNEGSWSLRVDDGGQLRYQCGLAAELLYTSKAPSKNWIRVSPSWSTVMFIPWWVKEKSSPSILE